MAPTRIDIGNHGEDLAVAHLQGRGLEVVARNWRIAAGDLRGELDVIALDHRAGLVVIVEVKTRSGRGYGGPLAAVTPRKQLQLRRLAAAFLVDARLPYRQVRFDVIGIVLDRADAPDLVHIEGAL